MISLRGKIFAKNPQHCPIATYRRCGHHNELMFPPLCSDDNEEQRNELIMKEVQRTKSKRAATDIINVLISTHKTR